MEFEKCETDGKANAGLVGFARRPQSQRARSPDEQAIAAVGLKAWQEKSASNGKHGESFRRGRLCATLVARVQPAAAST